MLGVCISSTSKGKDNSNKQFNKILDRSTSEFYSQWLCVGRDETVASLVASTLWFSLDAAKAIWSTASGATEATAVIFLFFILFYDFTFCILYPYFFEIFLY